MPSFTIFSATWRCTGALCSARNTDPKPPSPIAGSKRYGPITVPGPSSSVVLAAGGGDDAGAANVGARRAADFEEPASRRAARVRLPRPEGDASRLPHVP